MTTPIKLATVSTIQNNTKQEVLVSRNNVSLPWFNNKEILPDEIYLGSKDQEEYLERLVRYSSGHRGGRCLTFYENNNVNQIISRAKKERKEEEVNLENYYKENGLSTKNIGEINKLINFILDLGSIDEVAKYFDCKVTKDSFGNKVLGVKLQREDKNLAALEPVLKFKFQVFDKNKSLDNSITTTQGDFKVDNEGANTLKLGGYGNIACDEINQDSESARIGAGAKASFEYGILGVKFENDNSLWLNTRTDLDFGVNGVRTNAKAAFIVAPKETIELRYNMDPDKQGAITFGAVLDSKLNISKNSLINELKTGLQLGYITPNLNVDKRKNYTLLKFNVGVETNNLLSKEKLNVKPTVEAGTCISFDGMEIEASLKVGIPVMKNQGGDFELRGAIFLPFFEEFGVDK